MKHKQAITDRPVDDMDNIVPTSNESLIGCIKEIASKLPYRAYIVIQMLYYENFTENEVSCSMGIPLIQVQSIHKKALELIKKQILDTPT